jgi:hypothetical protein
MSQTKRYRNSGDVGVIAICAKDERPTDSGLAQRRFQEVQRKSVRTIGQPDTAAE